uniref:Uncharacterized protein n=1 Tax=Romanomermis culicivorax TaxID=13658 RepID=A0A915K1Q1_ROMCU
MEAKTQKQETEEEKIQTQIDEAATKMSGIDVRLDKMQEASQEICVQIKDPKEFDWQKKYIETQERDLHAIRPSINNLPQHADHATEHEIDPIQH